jgi:hypothetical protein
MILVFPTSSRKVQLRQSSTLAALARRRLREGVIWPGMVRRVTDRNRTSVLTLIERIHSGIKPHACDFPKCGKRFIQRSALNVHIRVHTGVKPHICERCDKVASQKIGTRSLTNSSSHSAIPAHWPVIDAHTRANDRTSAPFPTVARPSPDAHS